MHDDSDDFDINHVASFAELDLDSNPDSLDSPRRRFNWGFHDGTRDASYDEPARRVEASRSALCRGVLARASRFHAERRSRGKLG